MGASPSLHRDFLLLLHAPTGRDAALLSNLLEHAKLSCQVCISVGELCREIEHGAGAVFVAEEALAKNAVDQLASVLQKQGAWSDLPLLILTIGGEPTALSRRKIAQLEPLGEITLLERPLRSDTIISIARAALRTRSKQYELRRRDAELQLITDHVPVFLYYIDPSHVYRQVNQTCFEWFGIRPEEAIGRTICEIAGEPHCSNAQPHLALALEGERVDYESQIQRRDGTLRDVSVSYAPDIGADSRVRGIVGLMQDITDQKQHERELQHWNEDLRRANQALEEFAYVASHDLQEPLRTVASYAQLLVHRYIDKLDEDAKQMTASITAGVQRMQDLIRDLLEYSRAGEQSDATLQRVKAETAVQDALAGLAAAIQEAGAQVTLGTLPTVIGNPQLLAQLFQNLIGNAIKYRSEQRPRIEITATPQNHEWVFAVRDNGVGFEPHYARQIFGVFKRLQNRSVSGTGIGLAICRRIVERHGGRIWAESEPGKGSSFYFTMPMM
jgi:PAS domain S-box-containing protein